MFLQAVKATPPCVFFFFLLCPVQYKPGTANLPQILHILGTKA